MKQAYILYALILLFIIEISFFELHYFWWATLILCIVLLLLFLLMVVFAIRSGKSFKAEYRKEQMRMKRIKDSNNDFDWD